MAPFVLQIAPCVLHPSQPGKIVAYALSIEVRQMGLAGVSRSYRKHLCTPVTASIDVQKQLDHVLRMPR